MSAAASLSRPRRRKVVTSDVLRDARHKSARAARASRAADLGDKETADISAAVALALHELAEAYEQAEAA